MVKDMFLKRRRLANIAKAKLEQLNKAHR